MGSSSRSAFAALGLWLGINATARARGGSTATTLDGLSTRFGIEVQSSHPAFPVDIDGGEVQGEPASDRELSLYAPIVTFELALYPNDLVRRAGLKRIVLCKSLAFRRQRRSAIPDFRHDTLFLDVDLKRGGVVYLRRILHHEFFHAVDARDDGTLYADPQWLSLDPPGFRYGFGGAVAQDTQDTGVYSERFPGFLNQYSVTGVEEDKAEIFAAMITDPHYVEARAARDAVIRTKVARMKSLLFDFTPSMDSAFWERIRNAKRPSP